MTLIGQQAEEASKTLEQIRNAVNVAVANAKREEEKKKAEERKAWRMKYYKEHISKDDYYYKFYNELMELENNKIRFNSIKDDLDSICFTTFKAQGEDDMVTYFFSNLRYCGCEFYEKYVNVSFYTTEYSRKDLMSQFYSENQDLKYKTNKSKQSNSSYVTTIKTYTCSQCGEKMNQIDYEITEYDLGKSLCTKCLENYLTSIQ